jgi:TPR repeat protein
VIAAPRADPTLDTGRWMHRSLLVLLGAVAVGGCASDSSASAGVSRRAYLGGRGVPKDAERGILWLEAPARGGRVGAAQLKLAGLLAEGDDGIAAARD